MRYPPLPARLASRLAAVEPSIDDWGVLPAREYRPCRVTLASGEVHDRVYVMEAEAYIRSWGVWPEDDRGKHSIPVEELADIEPSPYRLPPVLATEIYRRGESGMGYFAFTVVLRDGREVPCLTGGAVDFADLPPGVTTDDVVAVGGRPGVLPAEGPAYAWCLYGAR